MSISPPAALTEEEELHQSRLNAFVAREFPYPAQRFAGRGIVIPAGGAKYFPCAWVCIKMLRRLGCALPIEVWHLGEEEMDAEMRALLAPLGVETVDARALRELHPVRTLNGWELKSFALLHCRFAEVLLLDADNLPIVDPAFLFHTAPYLEHGAIFWPDYGRLAESRSIWTIADVQYRDEPEFESGSIVIDKARCWKALNVAMHFNEYSDFYYRHFHGDKESFHLAWRKIGQEYAMIPHPIHRLPGVMCQHDFEGRRIFQHRNMAKWEIESENRRIPGFDFEEECLRWIEELRSQHGWRPVRIRRWDPRRRSPVENAAAVELTRVRYHYHRMGHDRRIMSFIADGRVAEGMGGRERTWDVRLRDGAVQLEVFSDLDLTFALTRHPDGVWRGRWEVFEKMPIELTPVEVPECAP